MRKTEKKYWVNGLQRRGSHKKEKIMTYLEIKKEAEKKLNNNSRKYGLFWAFSNEQLQEEIDKLKGEELISIGGGSFLPKANLKDWEAGMDEVIAWKRETAKKLSGEDRKKMISYELSNYESWYTGDISDAMNVLGEFGVKRAEAMEVYRAEAVNYD